MYNKESINSPQLLRVFVDQPNELLQEGFCASLSLHEILELVYEEEGFLTMSDDKPPWLTVSRPIR